MLVIVGIVLLFEFTYSQNPKLTIDLNKDEQPAVGFLKLENSGFFAKEQNTNFGFYRWTKPQFSLNLPYLAKADYTVRLWLYPPDPVEPSPLSIRANDKDVAIINTITKGLHEYEALVPAAAIQDGMLNLQFQVAPFEVKNDQRGRLGIIVTKIEVERMPVGLLIPPRALFISVGLLLLLWALFIFGVYPRLRRWQFWATFLTIAFAQSLWLSIQWNIGAALDDFIFNFSRLVLIEYALVISVFVARFLIRWSVKKAAPTEKEIVAGGKNEIFPLSSLRFIAALMVLFVHLPIDPDVPMYCYRLIRNGYIRGKPVFCTERFYPLLYLLPDSSKGLEG